MALRAGVLATARVPLNPSLAQQAAAPASLQFWRGFADASYLDKQEVTDRVLGVVKNFEKVEEGKVRWSGTGGGQGDGWARRRPPIGAAGLGWEHAAAGQRRHSGGGSSAVECSGASSAA